MPYASDTDSNESGDLVHKTRAVLSAIYPIHMNRIFSILLERYAAKSCSFICFFVFTRFIIIFVKVKLIKYFTVFTLGYCGNVTCWWEWVVKWFSPMRTCKTRGMSVFAGVTGASWWCKLVLTLWCCRCAEGRQRLSAGKVQPLQF